MAVIFLVAEFWGFAPTFCNTQKQTYYRNEFCWRTTPLFLTPYQSLAAKGRTACRCFRLLRKYVSIFFLFTYVITPRKDESAPLKCSLIRHVDKDSIIAFVAVIFRIKLEARRERLHCSLDNPITLCVCEETFLTLI